MTKKRQFVNSSFMGMVVITGIVFVLLIGLVVECRKLTIQNDKYETFKLELQQQIDDEKLRADDIENLKDYIGTEQYIEKLAREKLGLVYSDEILFKAED